MKTTVQMYTRKIEMEYYYHAGFRAFVNNKPRETDSLIDNPEYKAEFYKGWDDASHKAWDKYFAVYDSPRVESSTAQSGRAQSSRRLSLRLNS